MKIKFVVALLALSPLLAFAQQIIRPSTCNYRYEELSLPVQPYITYTNWIFDLFYSNLPQGRTYRRQVSENGRDWRFEGSPIIVPEIPGATASFTEGIDIRPIPPPIHFMRLAVTETNAPTESAMRKAFNLIMKDQPATRGMFGRRKLRQQVTIDVAPHGRLTFKPK